MTTKTSLSKKRKHTSGFKKQRNARIFRIKTAAGEELQRVTSAAWAFATAALWNRHQFSESECVAAKAKITSYLVNEQNKDAALREFTQRILLAKKFILSIFGETLPIPSLWFDENNVNGHEATKELFNELERQRKSEPSSLAEFNLVAEAVVSFSRKPSGTAYRAFKESLLIIKAQEMALLFQLFAANLRYEQH